MVQEFNDVFDNKPEDALYPKLIEEEYEEWLEEYYKDEYHWNPEKELKEMCDLLYVILGHAYMMGYDIEEGFRRVHQSNMSKLGNDGKPLRNSDGKVLKGPNYIPASMHGLT